MEKLFGRVIMHSLLLEKMTAHSGKCVKCKDGVVKMPLSSAGELQPKNCYCIACGQNYHMEIKDLNAFEQQQWKEKGELT